MLLFKAQTRVDSCPSLSTSLHIFFYSEGIKGLCVYPYTLITVCFHIRAAFWDILDPTSSAIYQLPLIWGNFSWWPLLCVSKLHMSTVIIEKSLWLSGCSWCNLLLCHRQSKVFTTKGSLRLPHMWFFVCTWLHALIKTFITNHASFDVTTQLICGWIDRWLDGRIHTISLYSITVTT